MTSIVSLRKADGSKPSYASYNSHRSAFYNMFRLYEREMSATLSSELRNHFRGLKRSTALSVAEGVGSVSVGKTPLEFDLYKLISLEILRQEEKEFIFVHGFLLLCWNLMCRAHNAIKVCYTHMEWRNNALGIYFAHQKSDQFGERPIDARRHQSSIIVRFCMIHYPSTIQYFYHRSLVTERELQQM